MKHLVATLLALTLLAAPAQAAGLPADFQWIRSVPPTALPTAPAARTAWLAALRTTLAQARATGYTGFRLELDRASIEPAPGKFDKGALATYKDALKAVREAQLAPLIVLQGAREPRWFTARGRWAAKPVVAAFGKYADAALAGIGAGPKDEVLTTDGAIAELVPWLFHGQRSPARPFPAVAAKSLLEALQSEDDYANIGKEDPSAVMNVALGGSDAARAAFKHLAEVNLRLGTRRRGATAAAVPIWNGQGGSELPTFTLSKTLRITTLELGETGDISGRHGDNIPLDPTLALSRRVVAYGGTLDLARVVGNLRAGRRAKGPAWPMARTDELAAMKWILEEPQNLNGRPGLLLIDRRPTGADTAAGVRSLVTTLRELRDPPSGLVLAPGAPDAVVRELIVDR